MAPTIDFPQWITAMSLSEHLTLLLKYLSVLTWPVVIVLGLFIFRSPLGELITRAESWTGPMNFGGKFAKNAAQNQAVAEAVEASGEPSLNRTAHEPDKELPQPRGDEVDSSSTHEEPSGSTAALEWSQPKPSFEGPPTTSPKESKAAGWSRFGAEQEATALGLLVSGWSALETDAADLSDTLRQLSPQVKSPPRNSADVLVVFQKLASMGDIPEEIVAVARETKTLRNQAVHSYAELPAGAVDDVIRTISFLRRAILRAHESVLERGPVESTDYSFDR